MDNPNKSPENILQNARQSIKNIQENNKLNYTEKAMQILRVVGHVEGIGAALDWPDKIVCDFAKEVIENF